jgi:hypothetical protein
LQAKFSEIKVSHTRSTFVSKQPGMKFLPIGSLDVFILGMVTVAIYQKLVMLNNEGKKN